LAAVQREKNHILRRIFLVFTDMATARRGRPYNQEDAVMKAGFSGTHAAPQRVHRSGTVMPRLSCRRLG
jgi:hypothetical protein